MPTDLIRSPAATSATGSNAASLDPLMTAAAVLLVILHFTAAVMLEKSHVRETRPLAVESIDEAAACPAEAETRASALPFD
jgi:hypothetical protein